MRYRIADTIIFNPEEKTLTIEGEDESVTLSIPASRLLEFMLKNKNTLHERDELLIEIWDKYGLKGSGSNLNQYISQLRRTLSGMDCEDFFITIPKVGFKVNPVIEVSIIEDCPVVITKPEGSDSKAPQQQVRGWVPVFSGKTIFYALIFVLIALTVFIYGKNKTWKTREIDPLFSSLGNTCPIVYLNKTSDTEKEQLNMKAMTYLKDKNRECSDNDVFIISAVNTEHSNGVERSFLSLCRGDNMGKIVDCNSIYSRR